MTLDRLVLRNFGLYGGSQELLLTPVPNKPIVLVGGMNGGGKTTILDAIQLALYGSRARTSNRGKLPYREYLRECIHRDGSGASGAAVELHFTRHVDGRAVRVEVQRSWHLEGSEVLEDFEVVSDGQFRSDLAQNWAETVEALLPPGIAHLFFFDGEQIKDLADGGQSSEIVGTAVHTLLGLDLVDRLEADLKAFERRKQTEYSDPDYSIELLQVRGELEQIDKEESEAATYEAGLGNEVGRLGKELRDLEEKFRLAGGEAYLKRGDLQVQLEHLRDIKSRSEAQLREGLRGLVGFASVMPLLHEAVAQMHDDEEVKISKLLVERLEARDVEVLEILRSTKASKAGIDTVSKALQRDRSIRRKQAGKSVLFDAETGCEQRIRHILEVTLPAEVQIAQRARDELLHTTEEIECAERDLARVPTEDRISGLLEQLTEVRSTLDSKQTNLEAVRTRRQTLQRQRLAAEQKAERLNEKFIQAKIADDDRLRILKHARKVRTTLEKFQESILARHATHMEELILESSQQLLNKPDLVRRIQIDPSSFEPRLVGRDGGTLAFDRLSAGERQLIATSMLWGLARLSGRPIPTVIDTPLGRLDSSHRGHLVERYFPSAAHQVILLSTDEEIVGPHLETLQPLISRTYRLMHDNKAGRTTIEEGYFSKS